MGRPRAADPKVRVSTSLRRSVEIEAERAAGVAGVSLGAWIERAVEAALFAERNPGGASRSRKTTGLIAEDNGLPRKTTGVVVEALGEGPVMEIEAPIMCAHPKDAEQKYPWGVVCNKCGVRLR